MQPDSFAQQQDFIAFPEEPSGTAAPVEARVAVDSTARSEANILQWMSYLPEDCIRTMIEMGWDVST
jgi:hypothetical protein